MILLEKLEAIESRRQFPNWEPRRAVSPAAGTFHPTLVRTVGLRGLEIPVGEWTAQFIETIQDHAVAMILDRHIADEENHDTQLEYLAEYMGAKVVPPEADALVDRWLILKAHPLLKKMVLEAGVFFPLLGMMGVYGKNDILIQSVRQWISSDEAAHVASSRVIINHLREQGEVIDVPPELVQLVKETIAYICGGVEEDRWQKASWSGLTTGKIEGGAALSTVTLPQQFTQYTNAQILYQSKNK